MRSPIGAAQARTVGSGASPAPGSRRSADLSAHDAMPNIKNTNGGSHTSTPSPASRCEATAPDQVKKAPAYAHSLSRGKPGATIAAAPPTCQTPVSRVLDAQRREQFALDEASHRLRVAPDRTRIIRDS